MLYWCFESLLLRYLNAFEWVLVWLAFFIAALFLHLHAYASAIVETVSENIGSEKDL
jgi:hypothetical protein